MDSTKSFIKIYNISAEQAEDFEFDFDALGVQGGSSDILTELVPNLDQWGDIGWMEVEEYEYNDTSDTMHFTLETKWSSPVRWLQQASVNCAYFDNKLMTMTTIQKDETCVTGIAIMDGEILQNKTIWSKPADEVGKYYDDDQTDYDLDELDNQIWDSIGQFLNVCEQFYLEKDKKND
tara:strand:- start:132 stop:665 length:534 start_codon:yes stop_codon:yes gene_type:complete